MAAMISCRGSMRGAWTAEHIGLGPRILQQWRVKGLGPPFMKIGGGVRYQYMPIEV